VIVRSAASVACAIASFLFVCAAASATLPARIDLRADEIGLYPFGDGSTVLAAEGHVVAVAGGRTITAGGMRFDLKANRLVAVGDVRVASAGHSLGAAAYALDLKTGTARVMSLGAEPATLTVPGDDLASAVEEPAPSGTFALADVSAGKPFLRTRHAVITPNTNVRLTPAEVPTGPGPYVPTPSYLYTFAATNFSQSALPAATFDQPYPLFGTANSLASGHFRYDNQNGATLGFDEHLVDGNRAYAVASILPLRGKIVNLNAFQQLVPGVTQTFGAFHQYGAHNANFANYALQWASPSTRTTFSAFQFNSSNSASLVLSTLDHFVKPLFTYKLQVGYGYDHFPGQAPFPNDFRISTYGYAASPNLRLPLGIDTSAKYEYSITKYDFPHETTNGAATLTLSRRVNRSLSFLGQIQFQEIANHYRDNAATYLGLPNPALPYYAPDGTPSPGFFAYAGINTYRMYSLQTTWRPRGGENAVQLYLYHYNDFPQFHGYGRPPYYATLDVTQRLGSTLRLELARSYAFGWNGTRFVPQYSVSISP
jgi:hypothetical protein